VTPALCKRNLYHYMVPCYIERKIIFMTIHKKVKYLNNNSERLKSLACSVFSPRFQTCRQEFSQKFCLNFIQLARKEFNQCKYIWGNQVGPYVTVHFLMSCRQARRNRRKRHASPNAWNIIPIARGVIVILPEM